MPECRSRCVVLHPRVFGGDFGGNERQRVSRREWGAVGRVCWNGRVRTAACGCAWRAPLCSPVPQPSVQVAASTATVSLSSARKRARTRGERGRGGHRRGSCGRAPGIRACEWEAAEQEKKGVSPLFFLAGPGTRIPSGVGSAPQRPGGENRMPRFGETESLSGLRPRAGGQIPKRLSPAPSRP